MADVPTPPGILVSSIEKVANWARTRSMFPATFGLACCAMEMMSADDAATTRTIRRASTPESEAVGFGTFWGRDLRTATEGDVVGVDGREFGGLGAFAWDFSDSFVAGIDLGYSAFMGDLRGGYGNTRIGTLRGGVFGAWSNDSGLFLDGALSAAWNNYDFTRLVPGTDLFALSNANGWQVDA